MSGRSRECHRLTSLLNCFHGTISGDLVMRVALLGRHFNIVPKQCFNQLAFQNQLSDSVALRPKILMCPNCIDCWGRMLFTFCPTYCWLLARIQLSVGPNRLWLIVGCWSVARKVRGFRALLVLVVEPYWCLLLELTTSELIKERKLIEAPVEHTVEPCGCAVFEQMVQVFRGLSHFLRGQS